MRLWAYSVVIVSKRPVDLRTENRVVLSVGLKVQ